MFVLCCQIAGSLDETVDQMIIQYSSNRTSQDQLLDSIQKHVSCMHGPAPGHS